LRERRLLIRDRALYPHRVGSRHGDEFGERAGKPRNAVLVVINALVRVPGRAVFAQLFAPAAAAVAPLIDDHTVADLEARGLASNLDHPSAELVPENLRLCRKRN